MADLDEIFRDLLKVDRKKRGNWEKRALGVSTGEGENVSKWVIASPAV